MKRLWTEERATYAGRHYELRDAIGEPKPVQRPHPPLWIGGSGEKLVLRAVARHADVWNHTGGDPAASTRLSRILDEHCAAIGRDRREIGRSVQIFYVGDRDALLRQAGGLVRAGFPLLVIGVRAARDAETVAKLLPDLRALG